jgi:DNA polymerase-3 subunit delta
VCRIIDRLRDEGVEPTLILWALSREAQRLSLLSHGSVRGEPLDRMMYSERVPKPAQAGVRKALSARGLRYWQRVVQRCAEVDRVLKGRRHGDVWDGLLGIGLSMARSPVC